MNEPAGQPGGYMRYTSPPPPHPAQSTQQSTSPYGRIVPTYNSHHPQAYQSFSGGAPVPPPSLQGQMGATHPSQPPMMIPNLSAWGVNDVTAQMGMQLGQNAIAAGQSYMEKNVS
jgi:hypothetical protein